MRAHLGAPLGPDRAPLEGPLVDAPLPWYAEWHFFGQLTACSPKWRCFICSVGPRDSSRGPGKRKGCRVDHSGLRLAMARSGGASSCGNLRTRRSARASSCCARTTAAACAGGSVDTTWSEAARSSAWRISSVSASRCAAVASSWNGVGHIGSLSRSGLLRYRGHRRHRGGARDRLPLTRTVRRRSLWRRRRWRFAGSIGRPPDCAMGMRDDAGFSTSPHPQAPHPPWLPLHPRLVGVGRSATPTTTTSSIAKRSRLLQRLALAGILRPTFRRATSFVAIDAIIFVDIILAPLHEHLQDNLQLCEGLDATIQLVVRAVLGRVLLDGSLRTKRIP